MEEWSFESASTEANGFVNRKPSLHRRMETRSSHPACADRSNSAETEAAGLHPLVEGGNKPSRECCGGWTSNGRYFVFQSSRQNISSIWIRAERADLFEKFQLNRSFAVHLIYQGTGARRRTRGRPLVIRNTGIQEIYAFETQFPNAVPPRRLTGNYSEPEAGFWRVGRFVWSLPIRGG